MHVDLVGMTEVPRNILRIFYFLIGIFLFIYVYYQYHIRLNRKLIPGTDKPRVNITVMTWNTQGSLKINLKERTEALASAILREQPDVIFLQELRSYTYSQLNYSLEKNNVYDVVLTYQEPKPDFTGIFYNRLKFERISFNMTRFFVDVDRTLLTVQLGLRTQPEIKLAVLGTHLSPFPGKEESKLRREQLLICVDKMESLSENHFVILGGDLNLEDGEEEGVIPEGVKDAWIEAGSPEDKKYTWEIAGNVNGKADGSLPANQKPQVRYDRLYFKTSKAARFHLKLMSMKIVGKEKVLGSEYFPSDHWGVIASFQVN